MSRDVAAVLAPCSWPTAPVGARALIDRELYLLRKWADDQERCRAAGIGEVPFATKPQLARAMFARAVKAGCRSGGRPLAVASNTVIQTKAGPKRADELAALVPEGAWQRVSCADGSKGPRLYDWALFGPDRGDRHLAVRRYRAWYRHVTLSMLAHAFLAVTAHAARPPSPGPVPASADAGGQLLKKGT